ncbi:hypothetical protein V6255_00825 [Psychromonas arctica]|uniref:Uncharacterized protein n=1 Tax=Psychromonas arctica TaxID=168275 RepID=A0ABU9H7D6_9GAMM
MSSHKWHWLHSQIIGGVLFVIAAVTARLWANIASDHYHHVWHNTIWQVSTRFSDKIHQINFTYL